MLSCSAGTAPRSISTLSLHDALPIFGRTSLRRAQERPVVRGERPYGVARLAAGAAERVVDRPARRREWGRSEEHTSELQSHSDLVCRLLLEKKKGSNIRSRPAPAR